MDKQENEEEGNDQNRIFLRYGIGIVNYFILQERMIKLLVIMSIIAVPQMLVYRFFDGFNYTESESLYARLSFGNMGYSSNYCGMNMINWYGIPTTNILDLATPITLQCQGSTRIRRVIATGLVDINQSGEANTLAEFNRCHYDKPIDMDKFPIMTNFNENKVIQNVME